MFELTPSEQLLARLIAFDTTSRNSNLALIDEVAGQLEALGVSVRLTHDDTGGKANLYARLGGAGQDAVVLSGHSDTVPVDGQHWASDPFKLDLRDGRLFGRGSADMKGFLACVLAAFARFAEAGVAKRLPLAIAVSYDEEVGCLGVSRMIDDVLESGEALAGCIVGEPTLMQAIVAHKGIAHWRCQVHGRAAHSSLTHQGVNAIEYAAQLVGFIRRLADNEKQAGRRAPLFDVPYNTLQTGWISGGSAPNIVPRACDFIFECRWLPGDDPQHFYRQVAAEAERLQQEMRMTAPESAIAFESLVHCPAFESGEHNPLRDWLTAQGEHGSGLGVAYTTEAGHFSRLGVPAVVCGPGSIEQAHKPDEFVERSQLALCDRWLDRLAAQLIERRA
ncbi:acetylornithine deacetylase [Crenobacter intestini]|uniref:Acetylornithine deacetylase n=1 Tax=Crenobacter intestini TaxID=2563443 RepID=A0A4T0V6R9_9NEIS|nr:acetylornithine deacetylase [Crenobacter intestini]TIC86945.1 acetylornithine deacetylase [Crenobacter intestini]